MDDLLGGAFAPPCLQPPDQPNAHGSKYVNEISFITAVPLLTLLWVATVIDQRSHRIPNVLSLGGALIGLVIQLNAAGPAGVLAGVLGVVICVVCLLPFYAAGGMAAGDVKLMGAVGAFLGPLLGFAAVICTLVAGSVIALICVACSHLPQFSGGEAMRLQAGPGARIPYAGAIAAGTTTVVLLHLFGVTTGVFA